MRFTLRCGTYGDTLWTYIRERVCCLLMPRWLARMLRGDGWEAEMWLRWFRRAWIGSVRAGRDVLLSDGRVRGTCSFAHVY